MKLSILIVNWNTRDLMIACLNSILKYAPAFPFEIIIVDNHSSDGSVGVFTTLFGHNKKIHLLQSLRNLGFARGNNHAYHHASGEYILLLNPDAEVAEGAIQKMVDYLERHEEIGVLGPKILNTDGTLQPSVRRFPGVWPSLLVFSGLHRLLRPRRYFMDDFDYASIASVDQVMGAALLTRRKTIERLGGLFDEKFWLWYEEVDFCKRAKNAGLDVVYYPEATVRHHGARSFSQISAYDRKKVAARSLTHYFYKNGSWPVIILIQIMLPTVLFAAKAFDYLQKFLRFKSKIQ